MRPANSTGTNIHPNNGVVERTTSGFAPKHSSLSLVSQPNCLQPFVHVVAILCCLFHCLCNTSPHTLQNLHWIMLHPSEIVKKQTFSLTHAEKTEKGVDDIWLLILFTRLLGTTEWTQPGETQLCELSDHRLRIWCCWFLGQLSQHTLVVTSNPCPLLHSSCFFFFVLWILRTEK